MTLSDGTSPMGNGRSITFFLRVPSCTTHMSRALFSSHARVSSSRTMRPLIPLGGWYMGKHPLAMWSAVCSAPQSQLSFMDNPQRSMFATNLPTPVRSLFSRVQARRDRPTPCPLFDGVGMNLRSLVLEDAHILIPPCMCPVFHSLLRRDRGH